MKLTALMAGLAITSLPTMSMTATTQTSPAQDVLSGQQFANMAASAMTFEIASSELALDRAHDGEILAFAQQVVTDNGAAMNLLTAAARAEDIVPSGGVSEEHQALLDQLSSLEDTAFDAAYLAAHVAHRADMLVLFQSYANTGEDGALRNFAADAFPMLEQHFDHVRALEQR